MDRNYPFNHCVVCGCTTVRLKYEVCYRCEHCIKAVRQRKLPESAMVLHYQRNYEALFAYQGDMRMKGR